MNQPIPPTGVCIERADGTVDPLELTYEGDREGIHVWIGDGGFLSHGDHLRCDTLPARTTISVTWAE
jgi:hypothetical protein